MNEATSPSARYRIVTELQGGGSSHVYLALADNKHPVVVKTPHRGLTDNPDYIRSFRAEARLTARLRHPNIVDVQEVVEDAGMPVLVMEYLDGVTLLQLTEAAEEQGNRLPLRAHLEILRQVCLGLHYCHELSDMDGDPLGLIHRDVSPHNVFVTVDEQVKLMDFGIAKIDATQGNTRTGMIKGKLRYMSPEQMSGERLDRRTDVYAIGVLLWEALTGRPLWSGISDALLVGRVLSGELPDPEPVTPGCTESLLQLARSCLATRRDDRPETCEAIADALELELEAMPPSGMTAGQLVTTLFAAERGRRQAQLAAVASGKGPSQHESHSTSGAAPVSGESLTVGDAPEPRRKRGWVIGLGATVGTLALLLLLPRWQAPAAASIDAEAPVIDEEPPSSLPQVAVMATPPLDETPAAEAESVQIIVDVGAVPDAEVRVDGELVPAPFTFQALRDGLEHTIVASAPGHETMKENVVFDRNVKILLRLTPVAAATTPPDPAPTHAAHAPRKSRQRTQPAATPTTTTPSEAPAPAPAPSRSRANSAQCNPPFEVDERGYKRFKRECI